MKDIIAQSLGLPALPDETHEVTVISPNDSTGKLADDFETTRTNLLEIIETGQDAIASVASLADQSQNARYYEVLASLLKTTTDANEKLLNLQRQIREIKKTDTTKGPSKVTNNLFVGTSDDLLKIIKKASGEEAH